MFRVPFALAGGWLGGTIPVATLEAVTKLPPSLQLVVTGATGTVGAIGALYAVGVTRRECDLKHHGEKGKIQTAQTAADTGLLVARGAAEKLSALAAVVETQHEATNEKIDGIREDLKELTRAVREMNSRPCQTCNTPVPRG